MKGFPCGPKGPGGFPGPGGQKRKLVKQFDKDGDGRLNQEERQAAREFQKKERPFGKPGFGPGKGGFNPGDFLVKPLLEALDVDVETRKLTSLAAFQNAVSDAAEPGAGAPFGRGPGMSLRRFAEGRRNYLLNHPEIKKAGGE